MPRRYSGRVTLPEGPAPITRKTRHAQSVSLAVRKAIKISLAPEPAKKPTPKNDA